MGIRSLLIRKLPHLDCTIILGPSSNRIHHLYTSEYATTDNTQPQNLHLNWVNQILSMDELIWVDLLVLESISI